MTNSYDNQTLYAYLLGLLPNEDTELLDEKTFTDPDFADSLNAAEKDLVDSYANGELSGKMLESFEAHYMVSPTRQQNVLFAKSLQEFAGNELASSRSVASGAPEEPKDKIGFFESIAAWAGGRRLFQFASAIAVIVLIAGGGLLLIRGLIGNGGDEVARVINQNSPRPIETPAAGTPLPESTQAPVNNNGTNVKPVNPQRSPAPRATPKSQVIEETQPVIAAITLVPSLRGGQKLAQLSLRTGTTTADFAINLESADYPSYKIELIDQDSGKRVWQAMSVKAQKKGETSSLNVNVSAKLLRSGVYSFSVSGVNKEGTVENIGDYPFRIVK
ncbi:MAG: hypothetical protein ACREO5_05520 [Candidatus Binatia bacterium]